MATITLRATKGRPLTNDEVDSNFINLNTAKLETSAVGVTVQAYDADLNSIAALTGTSGLLRKTAANTWALDTGTYLTGNQTITLSGDATGSGTTSIAVTLNTVPVSKGGTGRTTLTSNSLLVGNGTGSVNSLNPGTSGNLLYSNGASWVSGNPLNSKFDSRIDILGTSGSSGILRVFSTNGFPNSSVSITTSNSNYSAYTLILPTSNGNAEEVLSTDGNGNLSWVSRTKRNVSYFYSSF